LRFSLIGDVAKARQSSFHLHPACCGPVETQDHIVGQAGLQLIVVEEAAPEPDLRASNWVEAKVGLMPNPD